MNYIKLLAVFSLLLYSFLAYAGDYIIVIDAGSSGSRAYIYKTDTDDNSKLLKVTEIDNLKVEPGISSIATSKDKTIIDSYVKRLTDFAMSQIPSEKHKQTKLYWYSTAGMRLVSPIQQQEVYQKVKHAINKYSSFKLEEIKTIPGKDEGAYMWLSSNYDALRANELSHGIIDMGGASTQIAYEVDNTKDRNANTLISFKDFDLSLFSYSFLGLGKNELRHQFSNDSSCFQNGFELPNGDIAEGNFVKCEQDINVMLANLYAVSDIVKNVPDIDFVVFDGISKTVEALNLGPEFTREELKQAGINICERPVLTHAKVTSSVDPYAYTYCFNSSYFNLLFEKYGFDANKTFEGSTGSWTKGVAVFVANDGSFS